MVMPPSLLAGSAAIVAVAFPVFSSTRTTSCDPQLGTHTDPQPYASPEQGNCTCAISPTCPVAGTSCDTWFTRELDTHTASFVTTDQSGVPASLYTACGCSALIGRITPGDFAPVRTTLAFGAWAGIAAVAHRNPSSSRAMRGVGGVFSSRARH
jgi:hypothetical protein